MDNLDPTFSIDADLERGEVQYCVSGLWDMATMVRFQSELLAKSKPLIEADRKIHALGEMSDFVTQTREISDAMRLVITESAKLGVVKTAIVGGSMLMKMQYKRLSSDINCEFFDRKSDAIAWLRTEVAA
jgi:hypothetical protein